MQKFAAGLAASALMLTACGPNTSDLDGDLSVNGTEPAAWTFQADQAAKSVKITIIGEKNLTGELPVKTKGEKDEVIFTSRTPEGDFVIRALPGKCEDGLTDKDYNWTATVAWKGETLKGCAGVSKFKPADEEEKPPG